MNLTKKEMEKMCAEVAQKELKVLKQANPQSINPAHVLQALTKMFMNGAIIGGWTGDKKESGGNK